MALSQKLSITQISQSILSNCSQVRILWTSTQNGSYNYTQRTGYYYYSINGGAEVSVPVQYTLPDNTTKTIVDTVLTVPHDNLGNAVITVRTWMDTHVSYGVVTNKETLSLDQIKRESVVSAADAVIGQTAIINIQRFSDSYTHSVYFDFGEFSGYLTAAGGISETEERTTLTSIPFFLPEDFYSQIPSAQYGICRLYCKTYLEDKQIGDVKTASFNAYVDKSACEPIVSGSVEDINEKTVAVTGDSRVLVRYMSTARVTAFAIPREYASINSIAVNGQEVFGDYLDIPNIESSDIVFSAVDSRNLTATEKSRETIILYSKLTCGGFVERKDPTSGIAVVNLSGSWYTGSFHPEIDIPNHITAECSTDGVTYFSLDGVATEGGEYNISTEISGLSYDRVHTVRIRISDRLMTVEKNYTVKKGIPVFDWGENDFRFHVPVAVESLTVGGKTLTDLCYPVGSVYISTAATAPELLFGGQWEQLPERFLLGAGSRYPALSQGGEESHALTISEMPAHSHTSYGWALTNDTQGSIVLRADGEAEDYKTRSAGGGEGHNNMPPYLAVYMWKRVK